MIDIAELKRWVGNPIEPGVDELLADLEARAVAMLETEAERHFGESTTLTEYARGRGSDELRLNEAPTAITSVHYRLHPGDTWTEIAEGDDDGFELVAPSTTAGKAVLRRKFTLTWSRAYEYRVIYDFGYTAGSEPGQIRQAVLDLVALKFYERGREGLESYKAGDVSWKVLAFNGRRDIGAVPGLARTVERWRGRAAE